MRQVFLRPMCWWRWRWMLAAGRGALLLRLGALLLMGGLHSAAAQAQGLGELLDAARANEPAYLAAKANLAVFEQRAKQAFGQFFPQATLSANTNSNQRNYLTRNSPAPEAADNYNSNSRQFNVTQPLWRWANVAGWRQASAAEAQAGLQVEAAENELVIRVVAAWLDLLAARDAQAHAQAQVNTARRQLAVLGRAFELGTASAPQVEEGNAKLAQAGADALVAQAELDTKRAALEQLTGRLRVWPYPLSAPSIRARPLAGTLDDWITQAQAGNPAVRAALKGVDAAAGEVEKQRAGHQPTLDAVVSYTKNSQAAGNFPGQNGYDTSQAVVGLQLNLPIFSGGTQSARVSEAVAAREKARHELESARRAAVFQVKQAWFAILIASAKSAAAERALLSARVALRAAQAGIVSGVKAETDVLLAQQQVELADRDMKKAEYDRALASLKVKAAAGALEALDFDFLDGNGMRQQSSAGGGSAAYSLAHQ